MAKFVGVSNDEVRAAGFVDVGAGRVTGWDSPFDWSRVDASAPPEPPSFDAGLLVKGARGSLDWITRAHSGTFLGINSPKVYVYEDSDETVTKWGSTPDIFEDLRTIRLSFGRQFGEADLLWPYGDSTMVVPTTEADILAYLTSLKTAALTELFSQADASNVKVVLTFMTLGGATTAPTLTDPWASDATQAITHAISMSWAGDHESNTITDLDGNTGVTIYDGFSSPDDRQWVLGTLDLRSPYKIYYVYLIAKQVAQLLLDLQGSGVPVFENLLGIEIFNEVNTGNLHSVVSDGASAWADALVAAVKGFSEVLGADLPALWWPSLASFSDPQPFADIQNFVISMVSAAQSRASDWAVDLSALTNQDYHWYHYRNSQASTTPMMYLQDNVSALSTVFVDAGLDVSISICETGTSAIGTEIQSSAFPYVIPTDADAMARFQAREVWRRVGTALCCGTAYVGWHTHMASGSSVSSFKGTGLRDDTGDESDETITVPASDALTRYSYWALRRLAGHTAGNLRMASFGGAIGEVIYPTVHPVSDMGVELDYSALANDNGEQMLVILHFEDTALSPHVYVLFMDSVAEKTVSVCVGISCSDRTVTTFRRYPTIPDSIDHGTTGTAITYNTGETPDWGEWYTDEPLPGDYTLKPDADPVLIHSDVELEFTVPCSSSAAPVSPPSAAARRKSLDRLVRIGGLSGKRRS